jgi:hypothetical protein
MAIIWAVNCSAEWYFSSNFQDGTGESEHLRITMHQQFLEVLQNKGKRYITVAGTHEMRMSEAREAIDSVLVFEPLKKLENK